MIRKIKYLVMPDAKEPKRAHADDAGMDLCCLDNEWIRKGERHIVDTHVIFNIPRGWVGLVLPRSSVAAHGFDVQIGVIDSGYRGTVKVCVGYGGGKECEMLLAGSKIAQLVVVPCLLASKRAESMKLDTERGANGFGSTGE